MTGHNLKCSLDRKATSRTVAISKIKKAFELSFIIMQTQIKIQNIIPNFYFHRKRETIQRLFSA